MRRFDLSKTAFDISVGMSCLIAVSAVFSVISYFASGADEVYRIMLSGLSVALSCTAAILIMRSGIKEENGYSVRKLTPRKAAGLIPVFLGCFAVYYLLMEASVRFFSLIGLKIPQNGEFPSTFAGRAAYVVCVAVVPAVMEELLFRGTVLRMLLPAGEKFAVTASGVLFAISHWQVQRFLPVFFISVVFAVAYLSTGSMAAPVILHLLNNLTVIADMWISAEAGESAEKLFTRVILILGAVSLAALFIGYKGKRERAIQAQKSDWDYKDILGSGGVWVMLVLYTVMILQNLGL